MASFFLSRIDSLVDPMIEASIAQGGENAGIAKKVRGQVALASAKIAYQIYEELFRSERFKTLAARGARSQRLLWASTSTKNPDYSDLKYLEPIIGPETINTVTIETLEAYRDHGNPESRLGQGVAEATWVLEQLPILGIDLERVTQQLEDEGVEKFNQAFDKLIGALEKERTTTT